jgi:hypothetical protein
MIRDDAKKNPYLKYLDKIEFVVTDACTGRCKHSSEGDHAPCGEHIDPQVASDAVRAIAAAYDIRTVMAFGGEPLLYPDAVCAILHAARECGIPVRQVITNGYFSKNKEGIRAVVQRLVACGVNDLLLSVDAFHQETIPPDTVMSFATEAKTAGIPVRLSPAWLVSETARNPYNDKTRELLARFSSVGIPVGAGNVVFPEGNALKHLAAYFTEAMPENPYAEDPFDVRCISFSANGDVLNGNVYERDVMDIIRNYAPQGTR